MVTAAKNAKGLPKSGKAAGAAKGKTSPRARAGKAKKLSPETGAATPSSKSRHKKLQKKEELHRDLVRELCEVRGHVATCSRAVAARMDAVLAEVLGTFEGGGIPGEPARLPCMRAQIAMLQALRDLKVKPEKGRLKDLGRMGELAAFLVRLMPQGV